VQQDNLRERSVITLFDLLQSSPEGLRSGCNAWAADYASDLGFVALGFSQPPGLGAYVILVVPTPDF
jgi:hypothetical protein